MTSTGPRSFLGLSLAVVVIAAACGTMHPFDRGSEEPEDVPDAGREETDGGGGEDAPRFRADVAPLLLNCTSCHSSGAGGYRATGDAEADVEDARAKADVGEPESSLLYTKPTNLAAHGGGEIFAPSSAEARTILDWIRAGAKDD